MERHLAIVRALYEAFARRDMPALLSLLSPDVEWGEPHNPYNPAGGMRKGHAGFLEWARGLQKLARQAGLILAAAPPPH